MAERQIAFLYGHKPSGHSQVAQVLATQVRAAEPAIKTALMDLSSDMHPIIGPIVSKVYLELIQKTPMLWDYLYDNEFVAQAITEFRELVSPVHRNKLAVRFGGHQPSMLVCCHALPCATLALEKEQGNVTAPLVAVLTDFGVHAYWISRYVDLYLAPTPQAADELARRGIERSRVQVTGIPIDPAFSRPIDKAKARRTLGLVQERLTVLISGGTKGLGAIRDIVLQLHDRLPDAQAIVICGNNEALHKWTQERFSDDPRVKTFAFTNQVAAAMAAADIMIGKAGGVTLSEALAIGLPMVFLDPLPGQEERNARYVCDKGAAIRVDTHADLGPTVIELLSSPDRLERMKNAALALGRPDSAGQAARELLALLTPAAK